MEKDLTQRLGLYLDEIEKAVKTGGEFAAEQAPLLVQEFLAWTFWEATLAMIAWLLAAALLGLMCRKFCKWGRAAVSYLDQNPLFLGCVLSGLFGLVMLIPAAINAHKMVKVSVAPRVVLVEEVGRILGRK